MRVVLLTCAALCAAAQAAFSQPACTVLHNFAETPTDGTMPWGSLIVDGATLYGTTLAGGSNNFGTVFSMNSDGTGYAVLRNFSNAPTDGMVPFGALLSDGSALYGTTSYGGATGLGTVFTMHTDGTGFSLLHSFAGGAADGALPWGVPVLLGSKLYGMTPDGGGGPGPSGDGTVFSLNTNGTGFALLHSFGGPSPDGSTPLGNLVSDGSKLYGMTQEGGANALGTVFSMNTDGTGFTVLHSFAGDPGDGKNPMGDLLLDDGTLYGMTYTGGTGWLGANFNGTVFSVRTDGSQYTLLHSFTTGPDEGMLPRGSLIMQRGVLYGMTSQGGMNALGTLFAILPDGSGYEVLHDFGGTPADGQMPWASLVSDGSALYGMTFIGGAASLGTAFSYPLPTPTPNYINLSVSPASVAGGGTVTLSYACDFSEYGYEGVPVDIYLAAIRDPLVVDDASSIDDALNGGAIYFFRSDMSLHPGPVQGPTWSRVSFPPVATTGSLALTLPAAAGNYVIATAFRYSGTTIYVRSDGKPVENSNQFEIH